MARKVLEVSQQEQEVKKELTTVEAKKLRNQLEKLIPVYGVKKTTADDLKKELSSDNTLIKGICQQLSIDKLEVDGWEMIYRIDNKHDVNEDRMLEIIKEYWSKNGSMECPYIKKVEQVDHDALEAAIYNGDIEKEVLMKLKACDVLKPEEKLFIKKAKEKKA